MKFKQYKYIWLPGILLIYFGIMAWQGRENFYNSQHRTVFIISILFEIAIIVSLFFALRKKQKLQKQREEIDKRIEDLKKSKN